MRLPLLERDFQKAIIDYAQLLRWRVYHVSDVRGRLRSDDGEGFPDLLMVKDFYPHPNIQIAAELKCGNRTTSPKQRAWLNWFDRVEGCAAVVWRPSPAPMKEPWIRVETWEGDDLGAIGARLRFEYPKAPVNGRKR